MSVQNFTFRHASQTSQGNRARQEDYAAVWQSNDHSLLAVLSDGMGGHVSGQVASGLASETFIGNFCQDTREFGGRMSDALDAANNALADNISKVPANKGMGCTLLAVYVDDNGLRWVSVGDSSLLLLRNNRIERLNADHSHGAILDQEAREGIISRQAARSNARRHALVSALTGSPIPLKEIRAEPLPLQVGDEIFLTSDGLFTLSIAEIEHISQQCRSTTVDSLVDTLVSAVDAKQLMHQDNTTVVAVRVADASKIEMLSNIPFIYKAKEAYEAICRSMISAIGERPLGLKPAHFIMLVVAVFAIGVLSA